MVHKPIKLFAVIFMLTGSLRAADLAKADELFAARNVSIDTIRQASKMYEKIIEKTKDRAILLHAIDRFGRLAVLEGEFAEDLFGIKIEKTDKIFSHCIKIVDYAAPKKLKEDVPEYYYWRASCIGLLASHASKAELVLTGGHISRIKKLVAIGQKKFPEYDGRAFFLLEAVILSRAKALDFVGLYQPERAIQLVDYVVEKGSTNYFSYILKAETQIALNQKGKAINTLENAIDELVNKFSLGLIPSIFAVENRMVLVRMNNMLNNLK